MITALEFHRLVEELRNRGFGGDIAWSENAGPPETADHFAEEAIFVICNSGMHHVAGRRIFERVTAALREGRSASEVFGHAGKAAAIDEIWARRYALWGELLGIEDREQMLEFCVSLPWIGGITKFHLAKNFGANVAKPDRHLQRIADAEGATPQALCDRLEAETGYRAATVDVVLWRAAAIGLIDTRALAG